MIDATFVSKSQLRAKLCGVVIFDKIREMQSRAIQLF